MLVTFPVNSSCCTGICCLTWQRESETLCPFTCRSTSCLTAPPCGATTLCLAQFICIKSLNGSTFFPFNPYLQKFALNTLEVLRELSWCPCFCDLLNFKSSTLHLAKVSLRKLKVRECPACSSDTSIFENVSPILRNTKDKGGLGEVLGSLRHISQKK